MSATNLLPPVPRAVDVALQHLENALDRRARDVGTGAPDAVLEISGFRNRLRAAVQRALVRAHAAGQAGEELPAPKPRALSKRAPRTKGGRR